MEILRLGEKIRRRRKALKYTLKDVAGNCVTPAQLSYVESGKCNPSFSLLNYICKKIDLDMNYLLETEAKQAEKYCDHYFQEYESLIKGNKKYEAVEKLKKIENISYEFNLDRYIAIVSCSRAKNAFDENDYSLAEENFYFAMQLFMKYDDYENIAVCLNYLSVIEYNRNDISNSIVFLERAIELLKGKDLQNRELWCKVLFNMARSCNKINRLHDFNKYMTWAVEEAYKLNPSSDVGEIFEEAAIMTSKSKNLLTAEKYIDETIKIYESLGKTDVVLINALKSIVYLNVGSIEKAIKCIEEIMCFVKGQTESKIIRYILECANLLVLKGYTATAQEILTNINQTILTSELRNIHIYLESKLDVNINERVKKLWGIIENTDSEEIIFMQIQNLLRIGDLYWSEKMHEEALEYLIEGASLYYQRGMELSNYIKKVNI